MRTNRYIQIAMYLLLAGVLPVFMRNEYYLSVLVFAGIYISVAVSLSMLMGYAGQISLGHAGFFAIGGYASAILTRYHGWPPLAAALAGVVLAAVAALAVGIPSLRLRGHYLAMATLGFGEIVFVIAGAAVVLTQGPSGFSGVPHFSIAGFTFSSGMSKYYLAWGYAAVVLILAMNIIDSRVGRGLRSIHDDETAAASMGVNVPLYKVEIFVFSAIVTSLAGSLYVHHMRFVSPAGFSLNKSILFLIMIMSGGMGSIWGAMFGAVLFTLLPEFLGVFNDYDILIYGLVLLFMMMVLPDGLAGLTRRVYNRLYHRGRQP